jgi:N-acetylglucosaminyl-diphospho-decaprenol L-rhamnosyltransferase
MTLGSPERGRCTFVDVVVVSFNSREHLRACIEPLLEIDGVRVIVVDNASTDGSLESIRDLPGVTAIAADENRGFASGCNVGWRAGSADSVLLLNPDARIDGASVKTLATRLGSAPSVGAVAPRIVRDDRSLDFSLRRFPRLRSTYAQALFLHRLFPRRRWADEVIRDPLDYDRPHTAEWVSGACLMVRRDVLAQFDGLDEEFFHYCEDTDLCRRIRNAGLEVWYEPTAVSMHAGGRSSPRDQLLPRLAASRIRYAQKHRNPAAALLERGGIALGALSHALVGRGGRTRRAAYIGAFKAALWRSWSETGLT